VGYTVWFKCDICFFTDLEKDWQQVQSDCLRLQQARCLSTFVILNFGSGSGQQQLHVQCTLPCIWRSVWLGPHTILLLLNWFRATPDRPFMSSKSSSQTRLIWQSYYNTVMLHLPCRRRVWSHGMPGWSHSSHTWYRPHNTHAHTRRHTFNTHLQ
jgi:hypothetical protein